MPLDVDTSPGCSLRGRALEQQDTPGYIEPQDEGSGSSCVAQRRQLEVLQMVGAEGEGTEVECHGSSSSSSSSSSGQSRRRISHMTHGSCGTSSHVPSHDAAAIQSSSHRGRDLLPDLPAPIVPFEIVRASQRHASYHRAARCSLPTPGAQPPARTLTAQLVTPRVLELRRISPLGMLAGFAHEG